MFDREPAYRDGVARAGVPEWDRRQAIEGDIDRGFGIRPRLSAVRSRLARFSITLNVIATDSERSEGTKQFGDRRAAAATPELLRVAGT